MKFVIAVVLCVLAGANAFTPEQLVKIEGHTRFCSDKVGIDYDKAKSFGYSVVSDDSESTQCYMKCFFERSEFLNDEGEWQKDVILRKLSLGKDEAAKAKLSGLVEKCSSLTGDNMCQRAYKAHNCYWGNIKL